MARPGSALSLEYFAYLYFIKFPAITRATSPLVSASSCAIFRGGGMRRIGCKYFTLAPAPCLPVPSCCCSSPALGVLMLCPPWRGLSAKNLTHFAQIFEFLHFICSPLRHFSLCCAGFLLLLLPLLLRLLLSARCFVSTLCELLASTAALSFSAFINLPALDSQLSSAPLRLPQCVYLMCVVLPKMFPVHDSGAHCQKW